MSSLWTRLASQLGYNSDTEPKRESLGGGCIDAAWLIEFDEHRLFVKTGTARNGVALYEAEAEGLEQMAKIGQIKTPKVINIGQFKQESWLALEYLDLKAPNIESQVQLGKQLAFMHQQSADHFGWSMDNRIGATAQKNPATDHWVTFFTEHRLKPQLKMLHRHQPSLGIRALGEQLLSKITCLFDGYSPQPSLLHGDLWSGNFSMVKASTPVLYDPACYYGDRETDLAMTEVFGGFSPEFYASYNKILPLDAGYTQRKKLYQLYHILNHANMFGGQYGIQSHNTLQELITTVNTA